MSGFPQRESGITNEEVIEALRFTYNDEEIAAMSRLGDRVQVPAGEVIMAEGEPGSHAVVIIDGSAEVLKGGVRVAEVGQADIIGEGSFLTDKPRNASVVAKTSIDLVVFEAHEFSALLDSSPRLDVQLRQLYNKRIAS